MEPGGLETILYKFAMRLLIEEIPSLLSKQLSEPHKRAGHAAVGDGIV